MIEHAEPDHKLFTRGRPGTRDVTVDRRILGTRVKSSVLRAAPLSDHEVRRMLERRHETSAGQTSEVDCPLLRPANPEVDVVFPILVRADHDPLGTAFERILDEAVGQRHRLH